jgi:hypothetical protein
LATSERPAIEGAFSSEPETDDPEQRLFFSQLKFLKSPEVVTLVEADLDPSTAG